MSQLLCPGRWTLIREKKKEGKLYSMPSHFDIVKFYGGWILFHC